LVNYSDISLFEVLSRLQHDARPGGLPCANGWQSQEALNANSFAGSVYLFDLEVKAIALDNNSNATTSAAAQGSATDALVLPRVEEYLAKGLDLKRWWTEVERQGGPEDRFPLERSFNRPTRSYGFYGNAPVGGAILPVMGNVQEMFYDRARVSASLGAESAEWMAAQLREFVFKYFMRVSSFRQPEAYVGGKQPTPPSALARLSWCPAPTPDRIGFGFSQLFYKLANSGQIKFVPSYDTYAIVDQREIGKIYEWLVLKVRIFDFSFNARPFGDNGPELVFAANESSYLVAHEGFINHQERPLPHVLGEYGIGYAFIKSPVPSPLGYGPGEFDAAIELINFRVYDSGYVSVRMIFIANRPTSVATIAIDPVNWSFRLADVFSLGVASRLFAPAKGILDQLPLRFTIDPVLTYVSAANAITGNYAANVLCISLEQLEKVFLLKHFHQHYQTVAESLLTWREIPDWLDERSLPPWAISGIGS